MGRARCRARTTCSRATRTAVRSAPAGSRPSTRSAAWPCSRDWRGRGVGAALLRALLEQARALGYPAVELHAQTHALAFYEKFGFAAYGEEFDECGIQHRTMRLALEAPAGRAERAAAAPAGAAPAGRRGSRRRPLAADRRRCSPTRGTRSRSTRAISMPRCSTCRPIARRRSSASRSAGRRARVRILVQDRAKAARRRPSPDRAGAAPAERDRVAHAARRARPAVPVRVPDQRRARLPFPRARPAASKARARPARPADTRSCANTSSRSGNARSRARNCASLGSERAPPK